ncbi:hypothetical protein SPAN111604_07870 [Sphingomonas antarctica]|uniref:thioredoxin family protein n=1 Tax=Sphingomonas antarctica TaxID=2040274 RepID=UPI0039EBF419
MTLAVAVPATAGEFMPISTEAFQAAMAAQRPTVFHVRTKDGVLCNAQHAVLAKLMAEPAFKDYVVLEVDFAGNPMSVKMLGAKMPATIIYGRGGVDIGRVVGATDEATIRALLVKTAPDAPVAAAVK